MRALCARRVRQDVGSRRHARRRAGDFQDDSPRQAGDDVHRDALQGAPRAVQEVYERSDGDFRRRRNQTHAARFGAALRQAGRGGEEPQVERFVGLSHVQSSRHLRFQRATLQGFGQALARVQLSIHRHSRFDGPRRAFSALQVVQRW